MRLHLKKISMAVLLTAICVIETRCKTATSADYADKAGPIIDMLRSGSFATTLLFADEVLRRNKDNCYASAARAIARYITVVQKADEIIAPRLTQASKSSIDISAICKNIEEADSELALVDADLSAASRCRGFSLDLCPSVWEFDWDQDGKIDPRDIALLEIEIDDQGRDIPVGDPRRRPMFRYDSGDLIWARAAVCFQRAAVNIILAYDWSDVIKIFRGEFKDSPVISLKLVKPERLIRTRRLMLDAVLYAREAKKLIAQETDDTREWLPNPRQKNHPVQLAVNENHFAVWESVLDELEKLLNGKEGLSLADLLQLAGFTFDPEPKGYFNLCAFFSNPSDISIDLGSFLSAGFHDDSTLAKSLAGKNYRKSMKPSNITKRLLAIKTESPLSKNAVKKSLKYILWFN